MTSNEFKQNKYDFSHFVSMALQNTMPWPTLSMLFKDLAPTLRETREIIGILLKELEALQSTLQQKQKLLEKYQRENGSFKETESIKVQDDAAFAATENIAIKDKDNGDSLERSDTTEIEDDIEIVEIVKERFNEEIRFALNEGPNLYAISKMIVILVIMI